MVKKQHRPRQESATAPLDKTVSSGNWIDSSVVLRTLALILLATVVYLPALKGEFLWDDGLLLFDNPDVLSPNGWWEAWVRSQSVDFFPLTTLSFWLEFRLWGDNPTGYHVVNVLLHAAATLLSWRVLERLRVRGAWFAAALFAVHPVCVESVAWIAERKNTLSQCFFLLTLLLYVRFRDTGSNRSYWSAVGSFTAALFAKTSVVVLPAVLLLIAWWQSGKIRRADVLRTVPFAALSLIFGLVTIVFQHSRSVAGEVLATGSLPERIVNAGFAAGFYLYKAIAPFDLMTIYPEWHRSMSLLLQAAIGIVIIALLTFAWTRRKSSWGRPLLFGVAYFLIGLTPVLGLIRMSYMRATLVADHFQYLSLPGITALMAAATYSYAGDRLRIVVQTGSLTLFALLSLNLAATYRDSEVLWKHTLRHNDNAWIAHYNLGNVYAQRKEFDFALPHFRRAVELRPNDFANRTNLGVTLSALGRPVEAVPQLRAALELLDDERIRLELANALLGTNRLSEAMQEYERVLTRDPGNIQALFNVARATEMLGHPSHALAFYEEILRLDPGMMPARFRLDALKAMGVTKGHH